MRSALPYLVVLMISCHLAAGQSQYKTVYNFGGYPTDARGPNAGFVYRSGKLFGTTSTGGAYCGSNCGTVFAMESFYGTIAEAVIYNFCTTGNWSTCSDGAIPFGGLVSDQSGNLYGTTIAGGAGVCSNEWNSCGTVFELQRTGQTWVEGVLHQFIGADGAQPTGQLTWDSAGNLYGMTNTGGGYGAGTVFELSPGPGGVWTEQTIHDFNPAAGDGANPYYASVAFDSQGNLYGTTSFGGDLTCSGQPEGCGTVFELSPNGDGTWSETVILRFGPKQFDSTAGVSFDTAGNLYGTTHGLNTLGYYGSLFRLTPEQGTWEESSFFLSESDGADPQTPLLIEGRAAYGTAYLSEHSFGGEVFKFEGGAFTVLHVFTGSNDGSTPSLGGPMLWVDGTLYGATEQGGTFGSGTIFELTP
jgi:uncharacterized repeat protein (TIGR03803 family)